MQKAPPKRGSIACDLFHVFQAPRSTRWSLSHPGPVRVLRHCERTMSVNIGISYSQKLTPFVGYCLQPKHL